jgi:16S rRNA (guanine(1405)-N(7))-methyltransferase
MILDEIKNKKEFRGLSDDFVSRVLVEFSKKYDIYDKKEKKKFVKEVRAKLRELHGAFRLKGYNKKEKYLEGMNVWDDSEACKKILKVHLSSRERSEHYEEVYEKLKEKITIRSVLDLGGGLNVFSLLWLGRVSYYGIELNKEEVDFCNSYMNKFGLPGGVRWGDVLSFEKYVHAEVTFLFKVLDGFESLEKGSTAKVLAKLTSPYIVASFATRSLGGKKRISPRRLKWFEKLLVDYESYETFEVGDEIYFVIKR